MPVTDPYLKSRRTQPDHPQQSESHPYQHDQSRRPAAPGPETDDADAHLLRLCLDLQLDAMLLTLGAAATYTEPGRSGAPAATSGIEVEDLPWRRWLTEDVELAVTLAADAQAGHATLPSTLGTELDHAVPATVVDNLDARYRSMRTLLADVLNGQPGRDDAWRPRLREALERCEQRLGELRRHRLEVTPPRGIAAPGAHHYLPGELLG